MRPRGKVRSARCKARQERKVHREASHFHGLSKRVSHVEATVSYQELRKGVSKPWRGVNIGGWLQLEPGPSFPLFHKRPHGSIAPWPSSFCEWDLMVQFREERRLHELHAHRERFITRDDFVQIRRSGLNAVRLPLSYHVVLGACLVGEPYLGPALEYVDRAVQWAEECQLEVVLDLHCAPGGESGLPPSGRIRPDWHWQLWHFDLSIQALEVLARRFCNRICVTGIQVCNEPCASVPTRRLCQFYSRAVAAVRAAGFEGTVVLPAFQKDLAEVASEFAQQASPGKICFDVHYYHCFGDEWQGKSLAQQLRAVEVVAEGELRRFPVVVGEWSLGLSRTAWQTAQLRREDVLSLFGATQLTCYARASHGWFFWNWKDELDDWNWQTALRRHWLPQLRPELPSWNGLGKDPLEEVFDPAPKQRRLRFGDVVSLRTWKGFYIDTEGCKVRNRFETKTRRNRFLMCHAKGDHPHSKRHVRNGDVIRLCGTGGRVLAVAPDGRLMASTLVNGLASKFRIHEDSTERSGTLEHGCTCFLEAICQQAQANGSCIDADDDDDVLRARWSLMDGSEWQRLVLEKVRRRTTAARFNNKFLSSTWKQKLFQSKFGRMTLRRPWVSGQLG